MNLPPTDEETALLEKELRHVVDNDRFILSPRIRTLQAILNKIRREPLPPMRHKSRRPKADTRG
jgi:hypothetical protein